MAGKTSRKSQGDQEWRFVVFQIIKDHVIPHEGNDHHPHLIRHKGLLGLSALLLFMKGAAIILPFAVATVTHADEIALPVTPSIILDLGNRIRSTHERPPLVIDERLSFAAQEKADDMASNGYFSHQSPDGKTALDRIHETGYPVRYAAENLAVHFSSAQEVQDGWMNSLSHRSILLDAKYQETGIGVASGRFEGQETIFVAQLFGAQQEQPTLAGESPIVTGAVVGSSHEPPKILDEAGRVLAQTFTEQRVDSGVRELYLYFIALLTALLLLTFAFRFRARHTASLTHAMLVMSLAFVLMLV